MMMEYKEKSSAEEFSMDNDGRIVICAQSTKDWGTQE
jgi:hypothetical protein